MKMRWIVLLVVTLALTGCTPSENPLSFTGSVEAEEIDISPEISGTILTTGVKEGDAVKKGQVLMALDTSDYGVKLESAKTALEIAKQKLSDVKDGNSKNQINQAKANVDVVQEQINASLGEIDYLNKELARIQALLEEGAATEQQRDAALRSLEREQAKYQGFIKQKDVAMKAVSVVEEGSTKQTRTAAQLEVHLKELEIQDVERTIAKGLITSPLDASVQTVNYNSGERITSAQKAITLIDLKELYVKIYVSEKYLHQVKQGATVTFEDEFLKGKSVTGHVYYISNKAEFTPKNIESKENKQEMVYEVRIKIKDANQIIKPGMFISVKLDS